ncbi:MAG: MBL fold metallo-hydrolase [Victivallales bacterium]|nr:MBL fold metallo-hydrolase [Victivallales bacterium]
MDFNITVLGSGSSGNAILLSLGDNGILIDAGFSRKEILTRLNKLSIPPETIKAILVTHEHSDHVKGLRVTADTLDIPAYLNYETAKFLESRNKLCKKKYIFDSGTPFKLLDFTVHPFRVAHDAIDPVGFIISSSNFNIGVALDIGHMNTLAKCRLKGCHSIILESNYDTELLNKSKRPLKLKRRIAGRFGHLSNDDALNSFHEILTENSKNLFLGHISSECNNHSILTDKARKRLSEIMRKDINLSILSQHEPSGPVLIS